MKKVYQHLPDVPAAVGERGAEIIERCLNAYGVARAEDLPEEGKVRLLRDLQGFFDAELPEGLKPMDRWEYGWRGALRRVWITLAGPNRGSRR